MTDRLKGCWVAFESDIREDDAEAILGAIRMIRHVAGVEVDVANSDDYFARTRVRREIYEKLRTLMDELLK